MSTINLTAAIRPRVGVEAVAEGGSGVRAGVTVTVAWDARVDVIPRPTLPPVTPTWWRRVSETYPDPNLTLTAYDRPQPDTFKPSSTVTEILGRPFVRVGGTDLTFWRGVPVRVTSWSEGEPLGWQTATLVWEHGTLLTGSGAAPVVKGAPLDVGLANQSGAFVRWLWRGFVAEVVRTETEVTVTGVGLLRQSNYAMHQPPFWVTVVDSGNAVADAMNAVISRRYPTTTRVTTSIPTARRGTRSETVAGYVQGLLSLMTTDDGTGQWTLQPTPEGVPVLRLKDRSTEHWTVTAGARGITARLTDDVLEDPNVIYGSGMETDGRRWDNSRWPGSSTNTAPPYPNSSPTNTITQGESDKNTGNGAGVSQLQARLNVLGFGCPVDGYFGGSTTAAVRSFQRSVGIQVDGVVGGQTWNALWPVKGVLGNPYFAPLAVDEHVEPYLYAADGAVAGSNAEYDPTRLRVEKYFAFGEGVPRVRAANWAAGMIARAKATPNVLGTIRLDADPQQGSRKLIRAGDNIRLRGYGGSAAGLLLHITEVEHDDETTALRVDARARDVLDLAGIVARDRDAVDPARRIMNTRMSLTDPDAVTWQSEAPAGIVPRTALWARLWSVLAIPVGGYGRIARTLLTTSPAAAYAAAVFSVPVSSAYLLGTIGDPLAEGDGGFGRLANASDVLTAAGMLIGWGQNGQAMGYFPAQTSATGGTGNLTGTFDEAASWEFATEAGYLYLAVYADRSTFLAGRLFVDMPWGTA